MELAAMALFQVSLWLDPWFSKMNTYACLWSQMEVVSVRLLLDSVGRSNVQYSSDQYFLAKLFLLKQCDIVLFGVLCLLGLFGLPQRLLKWDSESGTYIIRKGPSSSGLKYSIGRPGSPCTSMEIFPPMCLSLLIPWLANDYAHQHPQDCRSMFTITPCTNSARFQSSVDSLRTLSRFCIP